MRWIFRLVMIVVVLVVAAIGLLFLLPAEKIGDLASAQLERATGRVLTLSGEFRPTIYPILGVKTGPFTISNAPWASEPYLVSAKGASVGVGLSALLGGDIDVQKLILDTPVINLERRADGVVNWDLSQNSDAPAASDATTKSSTQSISLAQGAVVNGAVSYVDKGTGQAIKISKITTDFALPQSGEASLDGTATWDGKTADIDVTISNLEQLLAGDTTELAGAVTLGDIAAKLTGKLSLPEGKMPVINAVYDVSIADVNSLGALVDITLPDLLKGAKAVSAKGVLQLSDAQANISGDTALELNGLPIAASFEALGANFNADNLRFDVTFDATGKDAFQVAWQGLVNATKAAADGTIDVKISNLPKMLSAFDQAVGFPAGTGKTASVRGKLGHRAGKTKLSKAVFGFDDTTLSGNLELTLDKTPYIAANLQSKKLNLSKFTSDDTGGAGSGGASKAGWSKAPIQISGLDAINADISLVAQSVDLGVSQLGKTKVKVKLNGGNLRLNLQDVRAFGGAIAGVVSFKGGKAVSFATDIKANSVQLEPLLGRLLDMDRLTGTGNTTLKMSGQGGSLYQIMHSLTGNGTLRVDKGSIKGIDLAAMMRNLKQAFGGFSGVTEFTSLTGTFSMKKGVLQNVDMQLISPLFQATGKGQINLGDQQMSYVVTPTVQAKGAEFSVPVTITGPWSNLSFKPDLSALVDLLAKGRLEDQKKALKAKEDELKAKAEAKLREALKIDQQKALNNQQDVEDAARKRAEEKLKQEAGNLLKKLLQ